MAKGLTFGLDGFGASAPAPDLYDHFGLTADKIVPQVLARVAELQSARSATSSRVSEAEVEAHPS
jgi:pyruvate dehydrogenase complex dehydrogenase (E1) component